MAYDKPRKRANANRSTAMNRGERRAAAKQEEMKTSLMYRVAMFFNKYGQTPEQVRATAKMEAKALRDQKKTATRGWRLRDWLAWRN